MNRQADTDRLYGLLDELSAATGGPRSLSSMRSGPAQPSHGVYFFFEPGQHRRDGRPRVVRVGTHALTATSKTTLSKRLSQHRGVLGGANPGGGNHRGSIFRLHVGAALIARGDLPQMPLSAWLAAKPSPDHIKAEGAVERAVSDYIGRMPVLALSVPTRDDGTSDRSAVEAGTIALLSAVNGGADPASADWLGRWAANPAVARSGLWNVRHVDDRYSPAVLDTMRLYLR